MQLTSYQIKSLTGLMTEQTEVFFEQMKLKIEQPLDLNELKNQFSWLEILDKLKLTFTTLIEVIGKGANILYVDGKLLTVKWYNIFGWVKLISVGKLFVDFIVDVYKIWSK